MAFTSKFVYFILILLFSLAFLTQPPSDQWNCGHGCFYAQAAAQVIPNRKVLRGSIMHGKKDAVSESSKVQGSVTTGYGGGSENWDQLRRVPACPDPLHHHGGSPKKPTTP